MALFDDFKLHLTGHVFVDVGIFVCMAHANKRRVEDITEEDLLNLANFLKELYCYDKKVQLFLHVNTFFNTAFHTKGGGKKEKTQEQLDKELKIKLEYAQNILFSFKKDVIAHNGDEQCVFFPELKAQLDADRKHIPLINGAGTINFHANGRAGIPISGLASLFIHAMPLGCFRVKGCLLAFQQYGSQHLPFSYILAKDAYTANTLKVGDSEQLQLPNYGEHAKTRYIERIIDAKNRALSRSEGLLNNLVGYYFTNTGTYPMIQILKLRDIVAEFVNTVEQDYSAPWKQAIQRNWIKVTPKSKEKNNTIKTTVKQKRKKRGTVRDKEAQNRLYETLFDLPNHAHRFLLYLRKARNWDLISIFLERILGMEQDRIDGYRKLGDELAEYVIGYNKNPKKFYQEFRNANYEQLRVILLDTAWTVYKSGKGEIPFTFDDFVIAFMSSGGYKLGRDLICFRLLEKFHAYGIDMSQEFEDEDGDYYELVTIADETEQQTEEEQEEEE
ncbi:MAG: hypothetical protein SFZ02_20920 [bacterium]|nr:hypothetical protein [bacterium]